MTAFEVYDDPAQFSALADPFLAGEPLRCTVITSMLARLADGEVIEPRLAPTPYWFALQRDTRGGVDGAAMRIGDWPPYLIDVSARHAEELATYVLMTGEEPTGANGTPASAQAFCDRIVDVCGGQVRVAMGNRLFQLRRLTPPTGVHGTGRPASQEDFDVLADMVAAFQDEASVGGPGATLAPHERHVENRRFIEDRTADGGTWVWVADGRVVSMAAARGPAFGFARIGPVYTLPEERGHGYAASATSLAAQSILDAGAIPCLFTDLANPTSNGVYQRLGFEAVDDTVNLRIEQP